MLSVCPSQSCIVSIRLNISPHFLRAIHVLSDQTKCLNSGDVVLSNGVKYNVKMRDFKLMWLLDVHLGND